MYNKFIIKSNPIDNQEKREKVIESLSYYYVSNRIIEKWNGPMDATTEILTTFKKHLPETDGNIIKSLFELISPGEKPNIRNLNIVKMLEIAKEQGNTYGFIQPVINMLKKLSDRELEKLSAEVVLLGMRRFMYSTDLSLLTKNCEALDKLIGSISKKMRSSTIDVPREKSVELFMCVNKFEELRTRLKKVTEPFGDLDTPVLFVKLELAEKKFDELNTLVGENIKKANAIVASLEQRNVITKGAITIPEAYSPVNGDAILPGILESIKEVLLSKAPTIRTQ